MASQLGEEAPMLRVAIVDDDPRFRALLRRWIVGAGHRVVGTGRDGVDAVNIVRAYHPDVVVIDVDMPRLDGIGAIPGMRGASTETRIVMLSGMVSRREEAIAAGAHAWVTKTGSPGDVLRAIHRLVAGAPS